MTLETHGLRYRYGEGAEDVIKDLDLLVPAGDHLAIVGPSGGGKSTLALLLSSVLRPSAGRVVLDGRPLEDWAPSERHRAITVIPQEAYVFTGTVQENLTYLCPEATTGQVDQAVTVFGLDAAVQRLGGLDATLPPGGQLLSAGERQLVALARAWLSSASIVVLDEATCHLDSSAEARAEAAFRTRGGTLIVIAHRFGSALRAHRALVADGSSWELGTHAELLTSNSRYRELYGLSVGTSRRTAMSPKAPAPVPV